MNTHAYLTAFPTYLRSSNLFVSMLKRSSVFLGFVLRPETHVAVSHGRFGKILQRVT